MTEYTRVKRSYDLGLVAPDAKEFELLLHLRHRGVLLRREPKDVEDRDRETHMVLFRDIL